MTMLISDLLSERPAINTLTSNLVIALAGASRSGKSTFSRYIADHVDGVVLSFADKLRDSAKKAGWDGSKEPEQRAKFFQELSQREKDLYGESYYADCTIAKVQEVFSQASGNRVVVIDDLRHFVELKALMELESEAVSILPVNFNNPTAEQLWFSAAMLPLTDKTRWAHHRSELEWRSFRGYFQEFENRMPPTLCSIDTRTVWLAQKQEAFNNFLRRASSLYYAIEHDAYMKHEQAKV